MLGIFLQMNDTIMRERCSVSVVDGVKILFVLWSNTVISSTVCIVLNITGLIKSFKKNIFVNVPQEWVWQVSLYCFSCPPVLVHFCGTFSLLVTGWAYLFLSFIGPPSFQFAAIMIPVASFEVHNKAKSMIVWHCWQIGGSLVGSVFSCMVKLDCCVGTCPYFLFCGKGDCIHSFLCETVPWNSNSLNKSWCGVILEKASHCMDSSSTCGKSFNVNYLRTFWHW